jgi:hypothetical protein
MFETASAAAQPTAIWLDAACMPTHEPARSLCLRSMGTLYAAAREVLVVLSPSAFNLLDKVRRREALGPEELLQLEEDDWSGRAWTYQEMVNSNPITFVAEGKSGASVGGEKLLNAVGHALAKYRKAQEVDAYEFRKQHAQLDALETLIEDWLMAEFTGRSAYRIMAAMESRTAVYPDDYLYATVGAITSMPSAGRSDSALSPPEFFLRVCERKQDFSFIYSTALRDSGNAGTWRPKPERLHPIVPWPITGGRQSGDLREGSLHLHSMARLAMGPLDEAARIFVYDWLRKTVRSPLPSGMGDAAHETLCRAGFAGCGQYVDTTCGLFFPQHSIGNAGRAVIFVAKDIFFTSVHLVCSLNLLPKANFDFSMSASSSVRFPRTGSHWSLPSGGLPAGDQTAECSRARSMESGSLHMRAER